MSNRDKLLLDEAVRSAMQPQVHMPQQQIPEGNVSIAAVFKMVELGILSRRQGFYFLFAGVTPKEFDNGTTEECGPNRGIVNTSIESFEPDERDD